MNHLTVILLIFLTFINNKQKVTYERPVHHKLYQTIFITVCSIKQFHKN